MDVRKLRSQIERERGGRRRPRRYSAGLRAQVVDHALTQRARGVGLEALASTLGLSQYTIRTWLSRAKRSGGFRQVAVQEPPAEATLITPSGYRVQGDATSLAAVLRALAS